MKRRSFLILIIFITIASIVKSQDLFMYEENGSKVFFHKVDSVIVLKFKPNTSYINKADVVAKINPSFQLLSPNLDRYIIPFNKEVKVDLSFIKDYKYVVYANPSLTRGNGIIEVPTDKVLVKIMDNVQLEQILKSLNINYDRYKQLGHDKNSFLIQLKDGESLKISRILYESGHFVYAQPSFTRFTELLNEFYNDQWGLNNTGQYNGTYGLDINATQAWEITQGNSDIVIAVIDQGVDLDHDDLNANLLTGYDATDGGLGGDNGDCWGNDAHGTCCAGIIASVDNLIGTIGVSSGCSIVPIRITYFDYPYDVWDDDWIVDGINHAWEDSGADILSCSWGGGRSITAVNNEISAALDEGRDDLGCIFVFSTGNANSDVLWPANSNPDIIAVGAMNPWGKRKSPTSDDTEDTWGSNFGDELDIVAPGVLIPTTDIEGSAGYNTQYFIHGENGGTLVDEDYDDEDYTVCFNGTSSAVPHVSGVAALILSVNPYLTQDQVRNIIESTAQKVGGYSYTTTQGRTNGTWDDEMGYGLLDAYNAVIKAAGGPISGESVVCSTGETFSIYPLASFDSIKWEIGPYLSIYSGQGTSSCTIRSTNNGSSYVTVTVYANGHQTTLPEMIVWSGVPLFTSISDPNPPYIYKGCTGEQYTFHSNPARDPDSQSSYQWMVEPGYYDWYFMYQYYDWVTIVFNDPYDYYQVIARASNVCGSSSWVSTLYSFGYIAMMDCYYFSMYPNPASDYITITLTVPETVQNFVKPADYTVQIIDNSGITCYSATRVEDSFTIPVISYKDGTYLVVIKYGDKIETLPLIVKH